MSEEKRYFTHRFADRAGLCIIDRERSGKEESEYYDVCMCRDVVEAKNLLDILNTQQDSITISRECAEFVAELLAYQLRMAQDAQAEEQLGAAFQTFKAALAPKGENSDDIA